MDMILLALLFGMTFTLGLFSGVHWQRRQARTGPLCPTCYGPTEADGSRAVDRADQTETFRKESK